MARPSHGDYQICKDAELRLSQMVDDILDRRPPPVEMAPLAEIDDAMLEWIDYGNLDFGSVLFN